MSSTLRTFRQSTGGNAPIPLFVLFVFFLFCILAGNSIWMFQCGGKMAGDPTASGDNSKHHNLRHSSSFSSSSIPASSSIPSYSSLSRSSVSPHHRPPKRQYHPGWFILNFTFFQPNKLTSRTLLNLATLPNRPCIGSKRIWALAWATPTARNGKGAPGYPSVCQTLFGSFWDDCLMKSFVRYRLRSNCQQRMLRPREVFFSNSSKYSLATCLFICFYLDLGWMITSFFWRGVAALYFYINPPYDHIWWRGTKWDKKISTKQIRWLSTFQVSTWSPTKWFIGFKVCETQGRTGRGYLKEG